MTENTYLLPIGETMGIAWDKVKGSKKSIWAALLVSLLIMFALSFFEGVIKIIAPIIEPSVSIIIQVIAFLIQMGIMYLGIRRAQDSPITFRMMFHSFESHIAIRIIAVYLLQIIILLIPIALMLIGGGLIMNPHSPWNVGALLLCLIGLLLIIYLCVRMMLAMAFVLDKGAGPWLAIKQSFVATKCNFWRVFAIMIAQAIIMAVSAIPLGIGLIWTLPYGYILYGFVYKNLSLNNLRSA